MGGYGAAGVLLLRSDHENPGPPELARDLKYAIRNGRKGVEQPEIQRQIWRDAVLGPEQRFGGTHSHQATKYDGWEKGAPECRLYD